MHEPVILSVCGGFLLAVLWMDLMFDVQVLGHREPELPESVLSSIAAYYRRVTTTAKPMSNLIAVVMLTAIITLVTQIAGSRGHHWPASASLCLVGAAVKLAAVRVVPNAVRLGTRADTTLQQSAVARSICRDHILCFIAILAFIGLQFAEL